MLAAVGGHENCVEYLIKLNSDIHICDLSGFTALHFAAQNGIYIVIRKNIYFNEGIELNDITI
jgi:ankyrin repeat protein